MTSPSSPEENFAGSATVKSSRCRFQLCLEEIVTLSALIEAYAMRTSSYRHLLGRVLDKWGPEEIRQLCDRQRADLRKILFPQDEAPVFP